MGLKLSKAAVSIPAQVKDNNLQILNPTDGSVLFSVYLPFKDIRLNSKPDYDNPTIPDVWLKVDVEIDDAEFSNPIEGTLIYNTHNQLVLFTKTHFVYSIVDMEPGVIFKDVRILRFGSINYTPPSVYRNRTYQMFLTCFTTSDVAFLSFAGAEVFFALRITDKNKEYLFRLCNHQTVAYPVWEWQSFGLMEVSTGERLECTAYEQTAKYGPDENRLFTWCIQNTLPSVFRTAPGAPLSFTASDCNYKHQAIEDDGTRTNSIKIYRDLSGLENAVGFKPEGKYPSTAYYNLLMRMMSNPLFMGGSVLSQNYIRLVALNGELYGTNVVDPTESIYAQEAEFAQVSKLPELYVGKTNPYEVFSSTEEKVIVPEPYAILGAKARIPYIAKDFAIGFPYFTGKHEFRENIRKEDFLYEFCIKR